MKVTQLSSISPLALPFPDLPEISGVTLFTAEAGYKDWRRCDLTFVSFDHPTSVAGVLTKSACPSPDVEYCRANLLQGIASALVVSAGNANAFAGRKGREAVEAITGHVAARLGCGIDTIFTASTGVIGLALPINKAVTGLNAAFESSPCDMKDAAAAIMTTDTFPKGATASAIVDGKTIHLSAIIKGSGMIAPDMATMLGFIFTDTAIQPAFLQELLSQANLKSFSCITVDSDTSTSDTVLAFATGKAGNTPLTSFDDAGADAFAAALNDICLQLAHLVVRDGEGAQKFIEIAVSGAATDDSARIIGLSIANSPLVKTAIAGEDANWGRVVMAVGKAGQPADRDKLSISFGGTRVAENGQAVDGYDETPVAAHLKEDEIRIGVDIGIGSGRSTVWTCDLTHGYIDINADYRS